jgi:hypothetical protein
VDAESGEIPIPVDNVRPGGVGLADGVGVGEVEGEAAGAAAGEEPGSA